MSPSMDLTGFEDTLNALSQEGRNVAACQDYLPGLRARINENAGIPFASLVRGFVAGMSKPVDVFFSPQLQACTNFSSITIPGFKTWTGEHVLLTRGLTYHESGHLEFTDREAAYGNDRLFSLINALEDVREENCLIRTYPGARQALTDMEFLFRITRFLRQGYTVVDLMTQSPASVFERFVTHEGLYFNREIAFMDILLEVDHVLMDVFFGRDIRLEATQLIHDGIPSTSTTADMVALAEALASLLLSASASKPPSSGPQEPDEEEQQNASGQSQQSDGEDSEESESQQQQQSGASSDATASEDADNDDEQSQGASGQAAEGEQDDPDESQDSSSNANGASSNSEPDDGDASEDDQSGPQSSQSTKSATGEQERQSECARDALNELLQRDKGAGDKGEMITEALVEDAGERQLEVTEAAMECQLAISTHAQSMRSLGGYKYDFGPASKASMGLRARLASLLQSQKYTPSRNSRTKGRLNAKRLALVPAGVDDIFTRREYQKQLNTAVYVCLDNSDSMSCFQGDWTAAKEAVAAMLLALDMPNVSYACSAFESRRLTEICDFGERITAQLGSARLAALNTGHYTPTAAAVINGTMRLLQRPEERRIMFVITDGIPDHPEGAIDMIEDARKAGIEVFGVGIKTEDWLIHRLFGADKSVKVDTLADLTPGVFQVLQQAMLRGNAA